jgi:hypothetical protein
LGGTIPGQLPFLGVGMNKSEFLAILRTERAKLEKLLAAVGISRMDVAGVSGFYSTKDIVAHLAAYDRALVKWLKEARAGRVYMDNVLDQPDLNARNAVVYETNKDRSAADVVEIFRQTLDELEACVEFRRGREGTRSDPPSPRTDPGVRNYRTRLFRHTRFRMA